jgi:cytochrome c oxidase cbb3-type subunit 3
MSGSVNRRFVWGGIAGFIVIAAGAAGYMAHEFKLRDRLLMADPDAIDAPLRAWAIPRGRAAYEAHCASCHGLHLAGDPSRGIPNLADHDWLYGTGRVGEIERIILYGIRSGNPKAWDLAVMPAFATANPNKFYTMEPLDPREVDDAAAYVYSLRHPATDPQAVARGDIVFHAKGFCFDCHGGSAHGDSAIGAPDLTDAVWLYGDGSLRSITDTIAHGLAGVCPAWIDRLRPDTIRSIAVYLNALSTKATHD